MPKPIQDYKSRHNDAGSKKFGTFSYLPEMNALSIRQQRHRLAGHAAVAAALDGDLGQMVACLGSEMKLVPLSTAVAVPRSVPEATLDEVGWFLI